MMSASNINRNKKGAALSKTLAAAVVIAAAAGTAAHAASNHKFNPADGNVNNYYINNYYYGGKHHTSQPTGSTPVPTNGGVDPLVSALDAFLALYKGEQGCFGDYWRLCRPVPTTLPPTTNVTVTNATTTIPVGTTASESTLTDITLPTSNVTVPTSNVTVVPTTNVTLVPTTNVTLVPTSNVTLTTETPVNTTQIVSNVTVPTNITTQITTNATVPTNITTQILTNATIPSNITSQIFTNVTIATNVTSQIFTNATIVTNVTVTEPNTTEIFTNATIATNVTVTDTTTIPVGTTDQESTLSEVPGPVPAADVPSALRELHKIVHARMTAQELGGAGSEQQARHAAVVDAVREAMGRDAGRLQRASFAAQEVTTLDGSTPFSAFSVQPSWSLEKCLATESKLFEIDDMGCRNYMSGVRACVSAGEGLAAWFNDPNSTAYIRELLNRTYPGNTTEQENELAVDRECGALLEGFAGDQPMSQPVEYVSYCIIRMHGRIEFLQELLANNTNATNTTADFTLPPSVDERDIDECTASDFYRGVWAFGMLATELRGAPRPTMAAISGNGTNATTPSPLDSAVAAASGPSSGVTGELAVPQQMAVYLASVVSDAMWQTEKAIDAVKGLLGMMRPT